MIYQHPPENAIRPPTCSQEIGAWCFELLISVSVYVLLHSALFYVECVVVRPNLSCTVSFVVAVTYAWVTIPLLRVTYRGQHVDRSG